MAAAAGAVAVITVGGSLAAGALGGGGQASPAVPTTTSPSSSPTQKKYELPPTNYEAFGAELEAIVSDVPDWAVNEDVGFSDYVFSGRCSKRLSWADDATAGGDGGAPAPPSRRSVFAMGEAGFPSRAQASDAVAELVARLETCTTTAWKIKTIAGTSAVLATSSGLRGDAQRGAARWSTSRAAEL